MLLPRTSLFYWFRLFMIDVLGVVQKRSRGDQIVQ